jgi:pyrimidine operon attenuation protein/uracil phosphoribosyltransferase
MRSLAIVMVLGIVLAGSWVAPAFAEDKGPAWKKELSADKQKIQKERQDMKQDAKAAHAEEKQLKTQIRDAKSSGEAQKAKQLKDQLKAVHQDNVQEMKADKKALRDAKQAYKKDKQAARKEGALPPKKAKQG